MSSGLLVSGRGCRQDKVYVELVLGIRREWKMMGEGKSDERTSGGRRSI